MVFSQGYYGDDGDSISPRRHDSEDGSGHLETTMSESSLSVALYDDTKAPANDQDFLFNLQEQRVVEEIAWFKDFQSRNPDSPCRKSFRGGQLLDFIDDSAPKIRIGITFVVGADKPTVAEAELKKLSAIGTVDRSPEWKVYTAATLLKKVEVGDDLRVRRKDDTGSILENYSTRKKQLFIDATPFDSASFSRSKRSSRTSSADTKSLMRVSTQPQTLTIDSEHVDLLYGLPSRAASYDLTCTLIEVDMFSMRDLMENYRTVVQSSGRRISPQEILEILDTMINDARRLCIRSPRLFRMSTRPLIAQSKDVRYGVEKGSQFITLTTSEGIRNLIAKSTSYYLALNENLADQEDIRPKFLQMIVLLLALINNDDLEKISTILESSFQIPGTRPDLELLIMKVLPLSSVNSAVFLEALDEAYSPLNKKPSYEYQIQEKIWDEFQQSIARKGYILPHMGFSTDPLARPVQMALNLEDMADEDDDKGGDPSNDESNQKSWMMKWGGDGIKSSAVFKYLQHDTSLRKAGDTNQSSIRAMNEIPYLDVTSEDYESKYEVEALLTNKLRYRMSVSQPEDIGAMRPGDYLLRNADDNSAWTLEIKAKPLNETLIAATTLINSLVLKMQTYFGHKSSNSRWWRVGDGPGAKGMKTLEELPVATMVEASLIPANGVGERHRVALAFKVANKIVFQDDILSDMTKMIGKLSSLLARLEKETRKFSLPKIRNEADKNLQVEFERFNKAINDVKAELLIVDRTKAELSEIRSRFPADPILKLFLPSLTRPSEFRPQWASYQTQLAEDKSTLITLGEILTVESAFPPDDLHSLYVPQNSREPLRAADQQAVEGATKLTFEGCKFALYVKPLDIPGGGRQRVPSLSSGCTLLWLGYFLVLIDEAEGMLAKKNSYVVHAFFAVHAQEDNFNPFGRSVGSLRKKVVRLL